MSTCAADEPPIQHTTDYLSSSSKSGFNWVYV